MIYRGSTPIHTFVLPFDLENITNIYITYQQNGCNVLHKTMADNFEDFSVDMDAREISVRLSQSDTLVFTCGRQYKNNLVQIQVRVLFESGTVMTSDVINDRVVNTLSDVTMHDSNNRFTDTVLIYDGGGVAGYEG